MKKLNSAATITMSRQVFTPTSVERTSDGFKYNNYYVSSTQLPMWKSLLCTVDNVRDTVKDCAIPTNGTDIVDVIEIRGDFAYTKYQIPNGLTKLCNGKRLITNLGLYNINHRWNDVAGCHDVFVAKFRGRSD